MVELVFDCLGAEPNRYAAGPTLNFRLRVAETTGARVDAIALRCQIRIEPAKRRYSPIEAERLNSLFGETTRWAETLRPLQLTTVAIMVPSFTGSIELDVPVACTYDLDVGSTSYFHALDEGVIPLIMLFSGTVFIPGNGKFSVAPVPWHKEAPCQVPVATWRQMMDQFFPGGGWMRLDRSTLDALGAFKNARALPTWDQTVTALLDEVAQPMDQVP